jgi:hypothetical protein
LLRVHPVGGLLRLAGGGKDCMGIGLQHFDPRGNICSMVGTRMVGDPQISENESAKNLDAALLGGVGRRTEPAREISVKPMLCS